MVAIENNAISVPSPKSLSNGLMIERGGGEAEEEKDEDEDEEEKEERRGVNTPPF